MKTAALAFAILLALPAGASAETLKGGLPGCMTPELLDQIMKAILDNDQKTGEGLLQAGCIITRAGIPVTVLDTSVPGKVKVEAHSGDQSLVMWTVTQNVLP
jgi:hypothetical protein